MATRIEFHKHGGPEVLQAVHNEEQLAALEEASLDEPVTVWMKLDTGMHRLGVRPEQAEAFYHRLTQCKNVRQPVNIVSHFARADEPKCGATEKQLAIFNTFCEGKPGQRSIAASGGILLWPQSHFDWVRPGIILYGVSPLEDRSTGADFGCQPVMSLTSSLIAVREHKAGEPVGYGGTWVSERDTRLGVVAMGYGDGYPRAAPSGTPVLVNGREVPIVGRVAMDMICVDLGPQAQDKAGDPVILWGEGLPVERIAEMTKVSAYELITRLTSRVAMKYVD
jgi:alanine racemase